MDRFILKPQIKVEDGPVAGVKVVVDTHSGVISSCNATAAVVLERLSNGATLEQLIGGVSSVFSVSVDDAKADVTDFFRHLKAMGYIDEVG